MSPRAFLVIAACLSAGLGSGAYYLLNRGGDFADCGASVVAGAAAIGGPFELVSETGQTVTEAEVIDRPALIYFGYTFCPDVCPLDAARNAEAVDLLKAAGHEVKPVFISVDPKRDTPEEMEKFTSYLHPDMLGLTGSPEQVKAAADAYRVFFRVPETDDEYYLVDHSAFTYLVLPGHGFVEFFKRDDSAQEIATRTACYLDAM